MIEGISRKIVGYLLKRQVIENTVEDKEYYQYGLEITISSMLNIILIMTLGAIYHSFIESIVFLILFIPIRQFTGGFHASSYLKCNLSFCICFTLLIILYNLTYDKLTTYYGVLISFVSVITIILRCPVENENKPISTQKKKVHKITASVLAAAYCIIGLAMMAYSNQIGVLVLYTLLLVTVLIIITILKEWGCKDERSKKGKRSC